MIDIEEFEVKEQSDHAERNMLIGEAMKITGNAYFVVNTKTEHIPIEIFASYIEQCKGNPKILYYLANNYKK